MSQTNDKCVGEEEEDEDEEEEEEDESRMGKCDSNRKSGRHLGSETNSRPLGIGQSDGHDRKAWSLSVVSSSNLQRHLGRADL